MKPQFWGVRQVASGICFCEGDYSETEFKQDFPQFYKLQAYGQTPLAPQGIVDMFISFVNESMCKNTWGSNWRYACGLLLAHRLTLYLQAYAPESETPQDAVQTGAVVGLLKAAKLGDSSVEYDNSALTSGTDKWGDLNATQYGQILASMARLAGIAGSYAI